MEAQTQHELVARRQRVHQALDGRGGFGRVEAVVFAAKPFSERGCVALLCRHATVEGVAPARLGRFGGVEELFERAADLCGEFPRGRVAPEVIGEPLALALDPDRALLKLARRADGPAEVAEVPADLALHGRYRERAEGGADGRVIAVQRLEQPDRGDLPQVIERNPVTAIEAPRDRVGERQVPVDQSLAGPGVAVVGVGAEVGGLSLALPRCVSGRGVRCGRVVTKHLNAPLRHRERRFAWFAAGDIVCRRKREHLVEPAHADRSVDRSRGRDERQPETFALRALVERHEHVQTRRVDERQAAQIEHQARGAADARPARRAACRRWRRRARRGAARPRHHRGAARRRRRALAAPVGRYQVLTRL